MLHKRVTTIISKHKISLETTSLGCSQLVPHHFDKESAQLQTLSSHNWNVMCRCKLFGSTSEMQNNDALTNRWKTSWVRFCDIIEKVEGKGSYLVHENSYDWSIPFIPILCQDVTWKNEGTDENVEVIFWMLPLWQSQNYGYEACNLCGRIYHDGGITVIDLSVVSICYNPDIIDSQSRWRSHPLS